MSCVIYFSYYINIPPEDCHGVMFWLTGASVYITTIYFAYLEWLQIESNQTYFFELTNWVDVGSAILNIVLIIKHNFFFHHGYDFNATKHWATLTILFAWYKTFYWMRLFTETAFFINLLS